MIISPLLISAESNNSTTAPTESFRHFITTSLIFTSAEYEIFNYKYNDILYPDINATDNNKSTTYSISYYFYLTPVKSYTNIPYSLFSLLSKSGYLNAEVYYVPEVDGNYNYENVFSTYSWKSQGTYNRIILDYNLRVQFYILNWTALNGSVQRYSYKYEDDYNNTEKTIINYKNHENGFEYSLGITQFFMPMLNLNLSASFYHSTPVSTKNASYSNGDWYKENTDSKYHSKSIKAQIYYVSDELYIANSSLKHIGISIGYILLQDFWKDDLHFTASYWETMDNWQDGEGEKHTIKLKLDQYYGQNTVLILGYSYNIDNEKTVNNYNSLYLYKTEISTYSFGLSYYYNLYLEFYFRYDYSTYSSKFNSDDKEYWLTYHSRSNETSGSISQLNLSISYRI